MREAQQLPQDRNGASTSKTYNLGDKPVKFGQGNIRGCTVLLVVSKYAVYQAHLWEVPSMRKKEGHKLLPNENVFQQNILEYLDHDNELRKPQLKGSGANGQYPNASPQVYIITPKSPRGSGLQYSNKVNQIGEKVNTVLGLPQNTEPKIYDYQKFGSTVNSVLFMYDPNNNDSEDSCEKEAAWNAWWSGSWKDPVFSGQWKNWRQSKV